MRKIIKNVIRFETRLNLWLRSRRMVYVMITTNADNVYLFGVQNGCVLVSKNIISLKSHHLNWRNFSQEKTHTLKLLTWSLNLVLLSSVFFSALWNWHKNTCLNRERRGKKSLIAIIFNVVHASVNDLNAVFSLATRCKSGNRLLDIKIKIIVLYSSGNLHFNMGFLRQSFVQSFVKSSAL